MDMFASGILEHPGVTGCTLRVAAHSLYRSGGLLTETSASLLFMPEALVVQNLTKRINQTSTLRDLSFTVSVGEIVALADPEPACSTTLLRLIAGLGRPDRGNITACGFDVWSQRSILHHRIAYLPSAPGGYPDLTVTGYLTFFEEVYGIPADQRHALTVDLLELVDLVDDAGMPVDTLPPERATWLGLARCLIHDPDLLLLDQPMDALPVGGRAELVDMLAELQALGKTVILSAGDALHLETVCSRVIELRAGTPV